MAWQSDYENVIIIPSNWNLFYPMLHIFTWFLRLLD